MYRLYYSPGACSMACHIVLEEIGAPYEIELVSSLGEREGKMTATATWRAVNPKGRIPALLGVPGRIGGRDGILTEVTAIMVYLAKLGQIPKRNCFPQPQPPKHVASNG
jgi:glutathione S-transferase